MNKLKKNVWILFSLLTTPIILFISTSNELYLINQLDLGYNWRVLHPFLLLFLCATFLGVFFYLLSSIRVGRYALWLYYLCGPVFLIYTSIRNVPFPFLETAVGTGFAILFLLIPGGLLVGRASLGVTIKTLAITGFFLLSYESYLFVTGSQTSTSRKTEIVSAPIGNQGQEELPNIYLLLMDEFQTEMFEETLTPRVQEALKGFTYFPKNTALFGRTGMSLPSIFSGKDFDLDSSHRVYQKAAFTSDSSILYDLKRSGYSLYAYVRDDVRAQNDLSLFDFIIEHEDQKTSYVPVAFQDLWIFRNLPLFLSSRLLGTKRVQDIRRREVLPETANISSYYGFLRFLTAEKDLPTHNRFTFIYLLIPHFPYIFDRDCNFTEDLQATSPADQSKCASRLLVTFIETLKGLGRFDDSLIIVCSDHGARFKANQKGLPSVERFGHYSLEFSMARARALLLVKPPRENAAGMMVSDLESSLLDVAPTIADSLGLGNRDDFDGFSLIDPGIFPKKREKKYYFYDMKGPSGWMDEMTQFRIRGNLIEKESLIKLNTPGKPDDFVPYQRRR